MPTKTCHRCGSVLHPDGPSGFCPRCLVQAGIDLSAEVQMGVDGTPGDGFCDPVGTGSDSLPGANRSDMSAPSLVGRSFGDYELLEQIARGGMGVVYRARQRSLDRIVALKMLLVGPHAPPEAVKRFRAEAVATAALQHPHIVAIHEVGLWEGHHFLAMEYVEGCSLAQAIPELQHVPHYAASIRRAAGWVQIVAEAIHYAHERGILHRDLKPSNILIDGRGQPRVTDFGLAKRLADASPTTPDPQLTLTGQVMGSPQYMPPEQASGRWGALSRRSDVYALGAILYHTLTGRPPFVGEGLAETMNQVMSVDPIPPRALNPRVPADLETVCLKCLEKEPGKRYATAQLLADELGRFLSGQAVLARPMGATDKAWRWCRRNPSLASALTLALLTFLIGLAGITWEWRRAERQWARAESGERLARQRGYVSDMNLAQQALAANNVARALELLDRHRPAGDTQADMRGWEWRYLWQQTRSDADGEIGSLRSGVRDLAASSDGRFLAASSEFGEVKVWDLSTRASVDLATEEGTQSFLAFSPDGRCLTFTDQGIDRPGTIGVWDARQSQRLAPIVDPLYVGPMGFSPDGRWFFHAVLLPDFRGRLKVLEFGTRKPLGELESESTYKDGRRGYAFAFTPDSGQLVVAEADGRIKRWDFLAGAELHSQTAHPEGVTALALSSTSRGAGMLATGAAFPGSVIKLWDMASFRFEGELTNHQDWISDLKFSPDGRTLASSSADQTIRLWDPATREEKGVLRGHRHEVWRLCYSADGQRLYSGARDGTIYRWPVHAPPTRTGPEVTETGLSDLALAPDGVQFAGIRKGGVYLGSARSGRIPRNLTALGTNNTSVLFSHDGGYLFAGTRAGEIQLWSLSQDRLERSLIGPADPVWQIRQDAQGRSLFALHRTIAFMTDGACRLQVWSVPTWQLSASWTHARFPRACALSPDGSRLATSQLPHVVLVWDLTVGEPTTNRLEFSGRISDLAFSPDGRFLAACNQEGSVGIWDGRTLRQVGLIRAHSLPVRGLAFSPDSSRLATASEGAEAIRLWDVDTWQPLITLGRSGADVSKVTFTTQGDAIAVVDSQGGKDRVVLWKVPSFGQVRQVEDRRVIPE